MTVMTAALLVGAGFRFERGLLHVDGDAGVGTGELAHHVVEHVVVLVAHEAGFDLQGHVAVAQVVGHLGEHQGIVALDGGDGFIGGDDFDQNAVGVSEYVAAAQQGAALEKQAHRFTAFQQGFLAALDARIDGQAEDFQRAVIEPFQGGLVQFFCQFDHGVLNVLARL